MPGWPKAELGWFPGSRFLDLTARLRIAYWCAIGSSESELDTSFLFILGDCSSDSDKWVTGKEKRKQEDHEEQLRVQRRNYTGLLSPRLWQQR